MKYLRYFRVLIADPDGAYRSMLRKIFEQMISRTVDAAVDVTEVRSLKGLRAISGKKFYLSCIAGEFLIESPGEIEKMFGSKKNNMALMVSLSGDPEARQLLKRFNRGQYPLFSHLIIKDNFSIDFLLELMRIFLQPVLKNK